LGRINIAALLLGEVSQERDGKLVLAGM
jgi:hypothetical protein